MSHEHECVAHEFHSPRPQRLDDHHVFPISWGGPEDGETVGLCQTGHTNVHCLLAEYLSYGETPPWPIRRSYGPGERNLAAEAWRLKREADA